TANLDQVTASKIMENLFSLYGQKGMLLITHNLDMLPRMDEILLIESARIIERGDFKSLREKGGRFTKLYDLESDRLNEY
ncbi:MAG: thiol reductant ABC exporter subunit CydC, partial [Anaerolineaceae bacterium]